MIFNILGHIDLIRNGAKTQTRRVNRGIYKVGKDYAVQRKRGVKAEPNIRIVMDRIREEEAKQFLVSAQGVKYPCEIYITKGDALAEGDYTPARFEGLFRELNPKWDSWSRWAFEFHVIEMRTR